MTEKQSNKVEELESIRGAAALLVVLFHMPFWNQSIYDTHIIRNSYYMVDLFFVLSGFVMFLNYGGRLRTVRDLTRFQLLRIGRLYPVHFLFLMVALLAAVAKWFASVKFGMTLPNGGAFKDAGLQAFIEHMFLVQALGFTDSAHSFNVASWSISVELYTYLVFGLMSLLAARVFRLWLFALFAVVSMALLHYYHGAIGNFSFILQCFAGYFMGCLTAAIGKPTSVTLPSVVGFAVLAALTVFIYLADSPKFNILIFFLSSALILAVILGRDGAFRTMLRSRVLIYLGLISYSVYMSHTIVLWACNLFVRIIMKRPESIVAGVSYPQLSLLEALVANAIAVMVTLVLSSLVFRWVEDPCRHKSRDWVRRLLP